MRLKPVEMIYDGCDVESVSRSRAEKNIDDRIGIVIAKR